MFNLLSEGYYAARGEGAKRQEMQKYYEVKRRQRQSGFGFAAQLLNLGSSMWNIYEDNSDLIKYAEGEGFKSESSPFSRIFSRDLKFSREGKEYNTKDMYSRREYQNYQDTKNALGIFEDKKTMVDSTFELPQKKRAMTQGLEGKY